MRGQPFRKAGAMAGLLPDFAALHPGYGAAILFFICLALLAFGGAAHAHAVLIETTPVDGAVVEDAPREVVLRFNEPVAPAMLRVVDVKAKPVDVQARVENDTVVVPLPPDLAPGTYVVSYRVISLDSHPVAGSIMFSIGEPTSAADSDLDSGDIATVLTLATTRTLFLAALLIAAGAVLALWLISDFAPPEVRRIRRVIFVADVAALAVGALLLGVAGCNFAGAPLSGLIEADIWRLALSSTLARSLTVAATGLVLILIALPRLERGAYLLVAIVGSIMAIASLAFTGHAATAAPQWLMRWAVPLHALCAAYWLGALPLLMVSLDDETPDHDVRRTITRFSAYALVAVALLLVLGVTIAVVQIAHLALLWRTAYGLVLVGKLIVVALLLGVAAHNKWHATPLLADDSVAGRGLLVRTVRIEYALFAAILALTAALGQMEPPRATVERDTGALAGGRADFIEARTQDKYRITLSVAPAAAGHNALAVDVADADGRAVAAREVVLQLALPAAGIEPLRRPADRDATGRFIYHGNDLALTGRWRIEAQVLIDDFTKVAAPFDVPIR